MKIKFILWIISSLLVLSSYAQTNNTDVVNPNWQDNKSGYWGDIPGSLAKLGFSSEGRNQYAKTLNIGFAHGHYFSKGQDNEGRVIVISGLEYFNTNISSINNSTKLSKSRLELGLGVKVPFTKNNAWEHSFSGVWQPTYLSNKWHSIGTWTSGLLGISNQDNISNVDFAWSNSFSFSYTNKYFGIGASGLNWLSPTFNNSDNVIPRTIQIEAAAIFRKKSKAYQRNGYTTWMQGLKKQPWDTKGIGVKGSYRRFSFYNSSQWNIKIYGVMGKFSSTLQYGFYTPDAQESVNILKLSFSYSLFNGWWCDFRNGSEYIINIEWKQPFSTNQIDIPAQESLNFSFIAKLDLKAYYHRSNSFDKMMPSPLSM